MAGCSQDDWGIAGGTIGANYVLLKTWSDQSSTPAWFTVARRQGHSELREEMK
jgi:hypothetical protein